MRGLYVVFEGSDGVGKTTTMKAVAQALRERLPDLPPIHQTYHPGSTPLGNHLRTLLKYTDRIDPAIRIDDLSRQMLYMVDAINFIRQFLEPALQRHEIVLADRSSFISAIAYGTADGLDLMTLERLIQLVTPPRADRLYVLRCPWQIGLDRLRNRRELPDHYEKKPPTFFEAVEEVYNNLITGPPERTLLVQHSVALDDVIYVDSTMPIWQVVDIIVADLRRVIAESGARPSHERRHQPADEAAYDSH